MSVRSPVFAAIVITAAAALCPPPVTAATPQQQNYKIEPGPLTSVLGRYAAAAGVALAFDPALIADLKSPGLNGSYTVDEGFALLLNGTALHAERQPGGGYTLRRAVSSHVPDAVLQEVTISGKAVGSTTEDTGSYTTRSTSSSTRLNLAPKETPQSLTVLTRQQIEDLHVSNLTDLLEAAPGIHIARRGIGDEQYGYYARGFAVQNFEVDGVPTNNGLNLFGQNPVLYDRVEIVRGATGLISGMGQPAATINLIRKRPTAKPQVSISMDGGNWHRVGATVDASGKLDERGNVRARLVADHRQQKGWLDRYEQKSSTLYGIAEVDLDDVTLLTVGFNHQRLDIDSPQRAGGPALYADGSRATLPRTLNFAPNWAYNDQQTDGVFISVEREWANGWTGKAEYSYTEVDYDFLFAYSRGALRQDGSGSTLLPAQWTGKPSQHNLDLYLTGGFTLFGREHELIGGLTLARYETRGPSNGGYLNSYANSADGVIANLFDYHGNSVKPDYPTTGRGVTRIDSDSAYVSSRLNVRDDLKLIVGSRFVRWDRMQRNWNLSNTLTSAVPSAEKVLVPYVGVVYDLNPQWALYGSTTKIFDPQGAWATDKDNNILDPLEGSGYEIGIKGSHLGGRLNSSAALFQTRQDNLPLWNQLGFYKAEQNTTSKGIELEINGELGKGWQAAAAYTHTKTTDAKGDALNTYLPRNTMKANTSYRLRDALADVTIGGGVRWQSGTGSDGVSQGGQVIANIMARYDIDRNLSVSLNVDNLFDRAYYSFPSNRATYAAPRSVQVSAKYKF